MALGCERAAKVLRMPERPCTLQRFATPTLATTRERTLQPAPAQPQPAHKEAAAAPAQREPCLPASSYKGSSSTRSARALLTYLLVQGQQQLPLSHSQPAPAQPEPACTCSATAFPHLLSHSLLVQGQHPLHEAVHAARFLKVHGRLPQLPDVRARCQRRPQHLPPLVSVAA